MPVCTPPPKPYGPRANKTKQQQKNIYSRDVHMQASKSPKIYANMHLRIEQNTEMKQMTHIYAKWHVDVSLDSPV